MKNTRGFTLIEGLLILVIVGLVGGTGWYVWHAKENTNKNLNMAAQTEIKAGSKKVTSQSPADTSSLTVVQPKDKNYTLKVQKSLLPSGTCTKDTSSLLLAITYNSPSYDYDCGTPQNALSVNSTASYSSIAFGSGSSSIVTNFGTLQKKEAAKLISGQAATKYTTTNKNSKTNLMNEYVIYETNPIDGKIFYGVYGTIVGATDQNHFLEDFNSLATQSWSVP